LSESRTRSSGSFTGLAPASSASAIDHSAK
jgi:hypothetical protein